MTTKTRDARRQSDARLAIHGFRCEEDVQQGYTRLANFIAYHASQCGAVLGLRKMLPIPPLTISPSPMVSPRALSRVHLFFYATGMPTGMTAGLYYITEQPKFKHLCL